MTQEVQPLAWQKRTNLEEHQQFFSKINEIIGNLAPTVNEAEQAIAQATQAVTAANAAVATANAASANADAAAQQAQTAAGTVAGYDDRMTAAESKNTQQDAAITALQTADGQNVKISGNQNITGIKTVPTEVTGTRSQQIANSNKIGAELDNYASMLRTTGNQTFSGVKRSLDPFEISSGGTNAGLRLITHMDRTNYNSSFDDMLNWCDPTGNRIISIRATQDASGTVKLLFLFHKPDGSQVNVGELGIDANGNVIKSGVFA